MLYQQWSENGLGSTESGAMNDCESPDTWGELNPGRLYEVFLITEQSLHPRYFVLIYILHTFQGRWDDLSNYQCRCFYLFLWQHLFYILVILLYSYTLLIVLYLGILTILTLYNAPLFSNNRYSTCYFFHL